MWFFALFVVTLQASQNMAQESSAKWCSFATVGLTNKKL